VPYSVYLHNYQVCASSGAQQLMLISVSLRPCLPPGTVRHTTRDPVMRFLPDTDAGNFTEMLGETQYVHSLSNCRHQTELSVTCTVLGHYAEIWYRKYAASLSLEVIGFFSIRSCTIVLG
jgi:hypothetical protein